MPVLYADPGMMRRQALNAVRGFVPPAVRRTLRWTAGLPSALEFGTLGFGKRVYFRGRGVMRLMPGDAAGAELTIRHGVREPQMARLWRRILTRYRPTLVLDVGANYGEFLMVARFPQDCEVIAVEPAPGVADALAESLRSHPDADRITFVRVAASDAEGKVALLANPTWSGASHTLAASSAPDDAPRVSATTVDALCRGRNLRRLAFKVDVEGFELRVLNGMAGTLAAAGSFIGMVEVHDNNLPGQQADNIRVVLRRLAQLGETRRFLLRGGFHKARGRLAARHVWAARHGGGAWSTGSWT